MINDFRMKKTNFQYPRLTEDGRKIFNVQFSRDQLETRYCKPETLNFEPGTCNPLSTLNFQL